MYVCACARPFQFLNLTPTPRDCLQCARRCLFDRCMCRICGHCGTCDRPNFCYTSADAAFGAHARFGEIGRSRSRGDAVSCMLATFWVRARLTISWLHHQVSGAAAAALLSAATHCGYDASLQKLVTAHCDYVLDALCRQLRHLEVRSRARRFESYSRTSNAQVHPRAPLLFSALLRRCGVARMLLPILAEPLQSAAAALAGACLPNLARTFHRLTECSGVQFRNVAS